MRCKESYTIVGNVSVTGASGDPEGYLSSDRITFECMLDKGHEGPHICKKKYQQDMIVRNKYDIPTKVYFDSWFEFKWKDEHEEAFKLRDNYKYDTEKGEWIK